MDPIEQSAEALAKEICRQLVESHIHISVEYGQNHEANIDEAGMQLIKDAIFESAEIGLRVGAGK